MRLILLRSRSEMGKIDKCEQVFQHLFAAGQHEVLATIAAVSRCRQNERWRNPFRQCSLGSVTAVIGRGIRLLHLTFPRASEANVPARQSREKMVKAERMLFMKRG